MMMMSSGDDKTEAPTAHKLGKARGEGNVPKSADFTAGLLVCAVLFLFSIGKEYGLGILETILRHCLSLPIHEQLTISKLTSLLMDVGRLTMFLLFPFLGVLFISSVGGMIFQVKPLFTTSPLQPNFSKLNPIAGFQKFLKPQNLRELLRGFIKLIVITVLSVVLVMNTMPQAGALSYGTPALLLQHSMEMIQHIMFWMAMGFMALGLADYKYQNWQFTENMKMTKQEVKDEFKNMEGDMKMKGKIRQFGQQIVFNKQIKLVPQADVVITNPTHFAVALRYDPDIAPAPHVLAKGVDARALKIREVAKQHNIEQVENRPLARSLYAQVEAGEMIPPELFVAVAEVLAYVYSRRGGR